MCALSVKGLSAGLSNKELRKAFCTATAVAFSNATHNNSKFEARNHIQIAFNFLPITKYDWGVPQIYSYTLYIAFLGACGGRPPKCGVQLI